jgi:quercetin dioxygenase-like cupin family protein
VIENRTSGERIFIRQSADETGGALLSFELVLAPGGRVPSGHVHPEQQERFTVLDGRMKFRVGIRTTIANPGETVTVERGKPHHFANAGSGPARLLVEVRPALGMEELLETASALAGHETWRACIRRGIDLALFLREFEREITVPFLPRALVRALSHPVAWFATSTGLDERYRRRRAGQESTGTSA